MSEWTSVKDRLPGVGKNVRMKVEINGNEFVWEGLIWQSPCPESLEYIDFPSPTHWMPLPEPPNE